MHTVRHVLWIDDEMQQEDPLLRLLSLSGLAIDLAQSGAEGLARAARGAHDVVVLDLRLPDMFGLSVLERLLSRDPHRPVLVVTGYYLEPEMETFAMRMGAAAFRHKPLLDTDEFVRLLQGIAETPGPSAAPLRDQETVAQSERAPASGGPAAHEPSAHSLDQGDQPTRAQRLATVVVGFVDAAIDAHSIEDLCRSSSLGVSASTFRRWCDAEELTPGRVLDFARILRGLTKARRHCTSLVEWLEVDPRTFREMLIRAGIADLLNRGVPTPWDFMARQQLVKNQIVLGQIRRGCLTRKSSDALDGCA